MEEFFKLALIAGQIGRSIRNQPHGAVLAGSGLTDEGDDHLLHLEERDIPASDCLKDGIAVCIQHWNRAVMLGPVEGHLLICGAERLALAAGIDQQGRILIVRPGGDDAGDLVIL